MKDYQKLVDECKKAYADNDLSKAWTLWEQINDILLTLDEFKEDDKVNRHFVWETYDKYMKQFTNEEVYGITDYGKRLAYRQMERERTRNILDESITLYELTKDDKIKALDSFLDFYEWCVLKNGKQYELYDLQTNEVVDDEEKTLNEVINRVVGRAIDYERNEHEIYEDEDFEDDYIEYLENLYLIANEYKNKEDKYELQWLNSYKEYVDELKQVAEDKSICLVCGAKKDDLHSAYCDKCWEEEKQRLGVD